MISATHRLLLIHGKPLAQPQLIRAEFRKGLRRRKGADGLVLIFRLNSSCSSSNRSNTINRIRDVVSSTKNQEQPEKEAPEQEEISIGGIVRSVRAQKRVVFANVNDGSDMNGLQVVLDPVLGAGYVYDNRLDSRSHCPY